MTNNCGVYQITNTITGDFYVGSSNNLIKRIWTHRYFLSKNMHCNRHLQNSWNKHGADNFEFTVLLFCDVENKLYYEQVLIDGLKHSYNIATCAMAPMQGLHPSEETLRKSSEARKGKLNPNFGKHLSEEHKRKLSMANIGKRHSEETRAKMSAAGKVKSFSEEHKRNISEAKMGHAVTEETRQKLSEVNNGECNHGFGKHRSDETKQKISEANKGELNHNFGRHPSEETRHKRSVSMKATLTKKRLTFCNTCSNIDTEASLSEK